MARLVHQAIARILETRSRRAAFAFVAVLLPFAVGTVAKAVGLHIARDLSNPPVESIRTTPFDQNLNENAFEFYRRAAEIARTIPAGTIQPAHSVASHRVPLVAYSSKARGVALRVLLAGHSRWADVGDEPLDGNQFYRVVDVIEDVAYTELSHGRSGWAGQWALAALSMALDVEHTTDTPLFSEYALPKMDELIRRIMSDPDIGRRSLEDLADGYSKIVPAGLSSVLVSI